MAFSMLAGQPIGRLVFALGGGAWLSPRLLTAEGALLAIGMQSQAVSDQGMITSNAGLVRFYQHQILHGEFLGAALFGPPTAASLPFWGDSMQVFHLFKQGSLFVTVSYQDASGAWVTLRVSNETISTGEYLWMQKLVTLPQVSFRAKEFGGYVALNWGSLTFLPDAFVDVSGNLISPPQKISVKAEWGATDLVSRLIFEGNAFLRSRNPDELGYDLFEREFKEKALEMGADFIATGHYAQKYEHTNKYELKEGVDKNKDQSYFLYTLNQEQLQKVLFPIGHLTKPEVRKLALKFKLPTATKKDSQGLCFIGKVDMKDFLSHYIEIKRGDVLNTKNEVIGYHDGAMFYTIGQRHGFTITSKSNDGPRLFVISKDLEQNTIKVADKESDASEVYSVKELFLPEIHFISDTDITFPCKISARIRYRQEKQECTLEKKTDGFHILFNESQNGVPVGQSAVLYDGEVCLGGGVIEKTN